MTSQKSKATKEGRGTLIDRLRELVAALDRRIPHIERKGEQRIARDSALLKKQAQERIAQLETVCAEDTLWLPWPRISRIHSGKLIS